MALAPIPLKTQIVDKAGTIVEFFRLRWEELRTLTGLVPARAVYTTPSTAQSASILTQLLYTAVQGGLFRVTFNLRRTAIDGAASSLQFVWHYTEGGVPLSITATANTTDTTGSVYSASQLVNADPNTNLTFDVLYTSTTPGAMKFRGSVTAEQVAQA